MTMGDPPADPHLGQELPATAEQAWAVLTSTKGTRIWLRDPTHPGLRPGAVFPLPDGRAASVTAVTEDHTIGLELPGGRSVRLLVRTADLGCELLVLDGDPGLRTDSCARTWQSLLTAARFVIERTRQARRPRQAVVVIHGIGNQRPLSTVKALTYALNSEKERWSQPDQISDSYELRRYQLSRTRERPRTDFFELYWADKVPGTRIGHTFAWARSILLRKPRDVGPRIRPLFSLLSLLAAAAFVTVVLLLLTLGTTGLRDRFNAVTGLGQATGVGVLLVLLMAVVNGFLISTLGDAARYLEARPGNISVRHNIRQAGVDLLDRLHADGGYHRVVIVGHSLGSVIAYDVIRLYWARVHRRHHASDYPQQDKLKEYVKTLEVSAGHDLDASMYQGQQRELWSEYRRLGLPWLITDLITVGSPLSHADTLLARSPEDFRTLIRELELPACPPPLSSDGSTDRLTFRETYLADTGIRSLKVLASGAPFALTRWTNIYIPTRALVLGDPIGGPVSPVFGPGVLDRSVTVPSWWRRWTPLAHTSYWSSPRESSALRVLRATVDLDSADWLEDHVASLDWASSVPL
jgi:hypothetical protein